MLNNFSLFSYYTRLKRLYLASDSALPLVDQNFQKSEKIGFLLQKCI